MDPHEVFLVIAGAFPSSDEMLVLIGKPEDDVPVWWKRFREMEREIAILDNEIREMKIGTRKRWMFNGDRT